MTMQLRSFGPNQPGFNEVRMFSEQHLGRTINRASRYTIWGLYGGEGTWNQVTEELEGRELLATVPLSLWTGQPEGSIVVHPNHRQQGLATRLLRWILANQYGSLVYQVSVRERAGLAFAARHGTFLDRVGDLVTFHTDTETQRIPHFGCVCRDCRVETNTFTVVGD